MTPDEIWAEVKRLHAEADRLAATLPSDYFLHDDFTFRHGDVLRGEDIEASEIEGVTP